MIKDLRMKENDTENAKAFQLIKKWTKITCFFRPGTKIKVKEIVYYKCKIKKKIFSLH